jgi:hypothetical protein
MEHHKPTNDYVTEDGIELPLPVRDEELEKRENKKYLAKKKKDKEDAELAKLMQQEDTEQIAYDPDADIYKSYPIQSDFEIYAQYYAGKTKPIPGSIANSIELHQFDINCAKPDYTFLFFGRRGSGKTFLARWLLYLMRKCWPFGIAFSRTKINGFWQDMMPEQYIYPDVEASVIEHLMGHQEEKVKLCRHHPGIYSVFSLFFPLHILIDIFADIICVFLYLYMAFICGQSLA